MSKLFQNYKRSSIEFVKAEGHNLFDNQGKKYLDFSSGIGVTNLGFNRAVLNQVQEQLQQIWHTPNLYQNSLQEEVAQKLIGDRDYLAFFCNSGAESNEAAIKLARKYTGKTDIISFQNSFHGRTYGAMSATGQTKIQAGFEHLLPGFSYAVYNDLASVKELISDKTAAVMLELVQGEGGVVPADVQFVKALSQLCQEKDILLIVDEVQTGIGRTGSLFAFEQYDIEPDIFTLAKGLANGLPIGAMIGKRKLSSAFGYGSHGTTFGGNKLVLSAASCVLDQMAAEGFLSSVQANALYLKEALEQKLGGLTNVSAIRGLGFLLGIQTSKNLDETVQAARDRGLIILTAGQDVIRLLPPITVSPSEIEQALAVLQDVFA